jgi:hypothetical protein
VQGRVLAAAARHVHSYECDSRMLQLTLQQDSCPGQLATAAQWQLQSAPLCMSAATCMPFKCHSASHVE